MPPNVSTHRSSFSPREQWRSEAELDRGIAEQPRDRVRPQADEGDAHGHEEESEGAVAEPSHYASALIKLDRS
ncbi:MAG: hypothetical protein IPJ77_21530 [Planctomycetes bacterium]|nr:hypothetical protein [Planctomycetota bacterium]